jgi:arylformamidase
MMYDISRPITETLSGWPNDTPFSFEKITQIAHGASCNVGAMKISMHFGTHVDSPLHYVDGANSVDQLSLDSFIGPAAIVEATGCTSITIDLFHDIDFSYVSRVLIRSGSWPDSKRFPDNIPTLADDVPAYLGKCGVKMIGVDVPSVDKFDSKTLPIHKALYAHNIVILESLELCGVPPGTYELIALPLKLVGADGSPVRAALRDLPVTIPEGSRTLGQ